MKNLKMLLVTFLLSGCAVLGLFPNVDYIGLSTSDLNAKTLDSNLILHAQKAQVSKNYQIKFNANSSAYKFNEGLSYYAAFDISNLGVNSIEIKSYLTNRKDGPGIGNRFIFYPVFSFYDSGNNLLGQVLSPAFTGGNISIPSQFQGANYVVISSHLASIGRVYNFSGATSTEVVSLEAKINYEGDVSVKFSKQ